MRQVLWSARNSQPFISPLAADDEHYPSAAVTTLRDEISHIVRCQFVAAQVETAVGLGLADQLNAGIRYVDIRCRQIQDIFAIHHDAYYLSLNFGSGVRDVCIAFS